MGFKADVTSKVKDYLNGDYEVEVVREIPSVENVPFGNKAKRMNLCALSIDLRDSTNLLFVHQKQTAGKIHKAFLHVAASTVLNFNGYIRGFKGDSLLAFWPSNYKSEVTRCVHAAMTIKYLLSVELAPLFNEYSPIDFGIGVDWGEAWIARAGIPRDLNNNDLIFMGKCINFAVAISEQARSPNHVEISTITYENLEDEVKYGKQKNVWGLEEQVDIWRDGRVVWNSQNHATKLTSWQREIG